MSFQRKRRRFIRQLQTARFMGGPIEGAIDEASLPLPVKETLRVLRQEIGQLLQALAQRNLDLLECRRELRLLQRFEKQVLLQQRAAYAEQPPAPLVQYALNDCPTHDSRCTPELCYFQTDEGKAALQRSGWGVSGGRL